MDPRLSIKSEVLTNSHVGILRGVIMYFMAKNPDKIYWAVMKRYVAFPKGYKI